MRLCASDTEPPHQRYDIRPMTSDLKCIISTCTVGCGDLVARSWLRGQRVADSKPDSTKIRCVCGLLHVKSYLGAKRLPSGAVLKFGEELRCVVLVI
ncbi:hypothetical protein AVEN_213804-1 [Araneus ventricosus]|uniref:Uncharacterized protein n=1 Tax=Araneus ventricosus TaxID=182803 RepID=A0A4Y2X142_ARAVE|nr:hypothetical protein AVEN_213804-1 [Araneus ventricosus]